MILLMLAATPLAACALSGEAIEGRVLEEGTNKPIPGAIVVVKWIGLTTSGSWFVEASTVCYHVETATTDGQGNYQTKAWRQPQHKDYTVKFDRIGVDAYKPGYGFPGKLSQVKGIEYLAPFRGSREERLKFLSRIEGATGCGGGGDSKKNLLPFDRAVYEEALRIAMPVDREIVDTILIQLGYEAEERKEIVQRLDKK